MGIKGPGFLINWLTIISEQGATLPGRAFNARFG